MINLSEQSPDIHVVSRADRFTERLAEQYTHGLDNRSTGSLSDQSTVS